VCTANILYLQHDTPAEGQEHEMLLPLLSRRFHSPHGGSLHSGSLVHIWLTRTGNLPEGMDGYRRLRYNQSKIVVHFPYDITSGICLQTLSKYIYPFVTVLLYPSLRFQSMALSHVVSFRANFQVGVKFWLEPGCSDVTFRQT
jgi:hypothetical protein